MKDAVRKILAAAAASFAPLPAIELERPKVKEHGELATNLAMVLAKPAKKSPMEIAKAIVAAVPQNDPDGLIENISIAGAGFLNLTLKKDAWRRSLKELVAQGKEFGRSHLGTGKKAVVEFVSANPTGPVHIGNARGGPLGDAIASLLSAVGYDVTREFYMNDVGGQVDKLGHSMLMGIPGVYLDENDNSYIFTYPAGESSVAIKKTSEGTKVEIGYQGEYVQELARKAAETLKGKIPREEHEAIRVLGKFGIDEMTKEIRRDCEDMGIRFDSWISEKQVLATETGPVLDALKEKGVTLEKDGAVWLAANDEFLKDRECVLVRTDGRPTYFANDIAYHADKYRRGFDRLINVWGSNHHGHVPRVQAAVKNLGFDPDKIETVLYQYVRVKRGNDAVKMSKRAGNFVTAREVLDEVGRDAFRFFLLMRAPESHLDFDLSLATEKSAENPVYYLQYAHARLCSIERKAIEAKIPVGEDDVDLSNLELPEEIEMIRMIHEYPEEIARAAQSLQPHRVTFYLLELAKAFQAYYAKAKEDPRYRVLAASVDTSRAKLYLCRALKLTFSQGLMLLGVSAPEVMTQETLE